MPSGRRRLEAYAVPCPTLGQLFGRMRTYFLEPTGNGRSIHAVDEPMPTLFQSRLAKGRPTRKEFTSHKAEGKGWEKVIELETVDFVEVVTTSDCHETPATVDVGGGFSELIRRRFAKPEPAPK